MKNLLGTMIGLAMVGAPTWAATGSGRVACVSEDGNVVALYSWFNSNADSWANLVVFNQEVAGQYTQYDQNGDRALAPLSVKTRDGVTITVTPDLPSSSCKIKANK